MKQHLLAYLSSAMFLPVGCQIRDVGSSLKHDTKNRVDIRDSQIPGACVQEHQKESKAQRYLNIVAAKLKDGNPGKFDHVCVFLNEEENGHNGAAYEQFGENVFVSANLFRDRMFATDAMVAGVLSHEFGHYAMDAGLLGLIPDHPALRLNKRYQELHKFLYSSRVEENKIFRNLAERMKRNSALPPSDIRRKVSQIATWVTLQRTSEDLETIAQATNIPSEELKELSLVAARMAGERLTAWREAQAIEKHAGILDKKSRQRWVEQTADEHGYEYLINAGFEPNGFVDYLSAHLRVQGVGAEEECREKIKRALAGDQNVTFDYGSGTHPDICWRMFNLRKTELDRHQTEYQAKIREAKERPIHISNPSLADALAEFSKGEPPSALRTVMITTVSRISLQNSVWREFDIPPEFSNRKIRIETQGDFALVLRVRREGSTEIWSDEKSSGLGGNARLELTLESGAYELRVESRLRGVEGYTDVLISAQSK